MAAANYDIIIDQGSDFAVQLTLTEDDAPKNLSGYDARAQLRTKKTSTTVSAEFECNIIDADRGTINMAMRNDVNQDLAPGIYYYDLEIHTPNDAIVVRLIQGKATVTQEVTR